MSDFYTHPKNQLLPIQFAHGSHESTESSGKFMQFHLILWLYGCAFHVAYAEVYAIAIAFAIFHSQPACHNLVNDAII